MNYFWVYDMMRLIFFLQFIIFFLCITRVFAQTKDNIHIVKGVLLDQYSQPACGVDVSGFKKTNRGVVVLNEKKTNDKGNFELNFKERLEEGDLIRIIFSSLGYETYDTTFIWSKGHNRELTKIQFHIKNKKPDFDEAGKDTTKEVLQKETEKKGNRKADIRKKNDDKGNNLGRSINKIISLGEQINELKNEISLLRKNKTREKNRIRELERELKKKEQEMKKIKKMLDATRNQSYILSVFIILVLAFLGMIVYSYRKIGIENKKNRFLMEELDHVVNNNLKSMSSILMNKIMTIKNMEVVRELSEVLLVTEVMFLLHSQLDYEDKTKLIDLDIFCEKLMFAYKTVFGRIYQGVELVSSIKTELRLPASNIQDIGFLISGVLMSVLKQSYRQEKDDVFFINVSMSSNDFLTIEFICPYSTIFNLDLARSDTSMRIAEGILRKLDGDFEIDGNELRYLLSINPVETTKKNEIRYFGA